MLVFIDDSGDAGFRLNKGSSRYFVIAAIIFRDNLEAEKAAVALKGLRRSLGFSDQVEFKFNGSRRKVREAFLEELNKYDFEARCIIVDKTVIRSRELRENKGSFYSYMIKTLLKYNAHALLNANIKIDGSGDRVFRKKFLEYLRKQLNTKECKVLQRCKLVRSDNNLLIQAADMLAGAVRRSYEKDKTDHNVYKSIIRRHIKDEWQFK